MKVYVPVLLRANGQADSIAAVVEPADVPDARRVAGLYAADLYSADVLYTRREADVNAAAADGVDAADVPLKIPAVPVADAAVGLQVRFCDS